MALVFAEELHIGSNASPFLGHEPNNALWQYGINGDSAEDASADPVLGQYDNLEWGDTEYHLTRRAVSRIGIINFPHVGAIGFYKDKYTGLSTVLAPVHVNPIRWKAPTLSCEVADAALHVIIAPPDDVTYTCYKVIMRSGYFAYEYVTYELDTSLPLPAVIGDYIVTAIGYNENTNEYSHESNEYELHVYEGKPTWAPDSIGGGTAVEEMSVDTLDNIWNEVFTGGDVNE